jgi:hypothetical protein
MRYALWTPLDTWVAGTASGRRRTTASERGPTGNGQRRRGGARAESDSRALNNAQKYKV